MSLRDYVVHGWNMLRSSLIGIWIGILPGVGATVASIVAYTTAKNLSRKPEEFGTGSEEAIVAAESANNATTGGTLIPLLTLGISGGLTDSILLGALVIHNLQPGPAALQEQSGDREHDLRHPPRRASRDVRADDVRHRVVRAPDAGAARLRPADGDRVLRARRLRAQQPRVRHLGDAGLRRCSASCSKLAKVPLAPFVVGLVLAPVAEAELRSGLMASAGSFMPLIERPVACTMLVLSAALFVWPFVRSLAQAARAGMNRSIANQGGSS